MPFACRFETLVSFKLVHFYHVRLKRITELERYFYMVVCYHR